MQLTIDAATRKINSYEGKLLPVDSDRLQPDPDVVRKSDAYRAAYPEITEVVGQNEARLNRRYFDESDLGNLLADILVDATGGDIGLMNSGGIRKDMPAGDIEIADILDTNPFVDPIVVMEVSGAQLKRALEQSFTLSRSLQQVSRLDIVYDTSKSENTRLVSVQHNGKDVQDESLFEVAVPEIIARVGDHFDVFRETLLLRKSVPVGELAIEYYRQLGFVPVPEFGRQLDLAAAEQGTK